jgi:hypothetical protein
MAATTLKQLKERVENLIKNQGEDAPVAAFIFTNEDVFVMDEDGEPQYQPIDLVSLVLEAIEDSDGIYEEIFSHIDFELQERGVIVE